MVKYSDMNINKNPEAAKRLFLHICIFKVICFEVPYPAVLISHVLLEHLLYQNAVQFLTTFTLARRQVKVCRCNIYLLNFCSFASFSKACLNICKCLCLSCFIVFHISTRSDLFAFWASLMYVPIVEYRKSASFPTAARILYVVFSS